MNRLYKQTCYLSGPIDFDPTMGKGWRDDMALFLEKRNVTVFNPLKHIFWKTKEVDTVKRPRMKKYLDAGKFELLRKEMRDLNHWDLRAVDLSCFLVVNYDISIHMCGTIEEMTVANKQNKPVLLVAKCGKKKLPSWIYGRYPHQHVFSSFDALKTYLKNIDENNKYKWTRADTKRWLFYDGKHMH